MKVKTSELLDNCTTLSEKEKRNLMILELIRKRGSISRSELARLTEINVVSISNYIKDYMDKKIVFEKGPDVSTGGRPPELVELNKEGSFIIGIAIGQTELKATITTLGLNVVEKLKIEIAEKGLQGLQAKSIDSIKELLNKAKIPLDNVQAIGIAVYDIGLSALKAEIKRAFLKDIFLAGLPTCAALGEKRLNPQADVKNLLYIYSDIGYGVVIRDGTYFGAGDIEGSQYLRPWSLELGIVKPAKKEVAKGVGTKIVEVAKGQINNITQDVVIEAARQNDELASDIVESAGLNLGIRIAYLVNLFNPEVVVIGGGIEKAGALILDPITKMVNRFALGDKANIVKIIPSVLGEDAVSLGAGSLAIREIFLNA